MSAQELEMLVRELKDREMIKELTHQYAHCVRQQDVEGVVNLFAEEGAVEMGALSQLCTQCVFRYAAPLDREVEERRYDRLQGQSI